jgi:DNA-binding winged helix-turn-helix (wHTH) protein
LSVSDAGRATGAATRQADLRFISDCIDGARCCALVGLSNVGKSDLMRAVPAARVRSAATRAKPALFVYIDFNLMLSVSEQGFYELILRSVLAALTGAPTPAPASFQGPVPTSLQGPVPTSLQGPASDSAPEPDSEVFRGPVSLLDRVRQAYQGIVSPSSSFAIALSFTAGLDAVLRDLGRCLVLLCDEFDEPFAGLDGRIFLNLRALRDRAPRGIIYVTATGQRLSEMRQDHGASEFAELFAHTTHFVQPLERADALQFVQRIATKDFAQHDRETVRLNEDDQEFLWVQAGGHPGLLEVASRVLVEAHRIGVNELPEERRLSYVHNLLDNDLNVRTECAKVWNDLSEAEHAALVQFLGRPVGTMPGEACDPLRERGIIVRAPDGTCTVFSELFRDFADRQRLIKQTGPRGLRINVDAGEVWVDGRLLPDLTAQEYRLLLLLYGNLDRICDKNRIVESVWSAEYMDDIDDARIEKLISRLRQKIEPNPDEPRYLVTIRGRGYKLSGGG